MHFNESKVAGYSHTACVFTRKELLLRTFFENFKSSCSSKCRLVAGSERLDSKASLS